MKWSLRAFAMLVGAAAPLLVNSRGAVADALLTRVPNESIADEPLAREGFVVEPFRNASDVKSLHYLCAGLPAFIAERLANVRPLRFVGPSSLLGSATPASAKWRVGGEFTRVGDKVRLTVSVKSSDLEALIGEVTHVGTRAQMPQLALAAAVEAFSRVIAGAEPRLDQDTMAPFSRDPYAFVLYARGVAANVGLRARGNGRTQARRWLTRALRIDPESAETMHYLGALELAEGKPEEARAYWVQALVVRPSYLAALADAARLDRDQKRPSACALFARLVALVPSDIEARRAYGELLADSGQYKQAKVELDRVLEKVPDDLVARRAMAVVLSAEGSRAALVVNLEKMVRLDDGNLQTRLDLAAVYASVGQSAEAEATYDEVLRRKPNQPAVLKLAGDLAFARGDYDKAFSCFARMHWLVPSDPRPVFRLGTIAYAAGDLKRAELWFGEATRFPGMRFAAFANLGAVLLQRDQVKESLWALGRAVKHRPQMASARFNLALALLDDGRLPDAMNEAVAARRLLPNDAGTHFLVGVVALRLGHLAEAEQAFRESLRLDPDHADAAHNLQVVEPLLAHQASVASINDGHGLKLAPP